MDQTSLKTLFRVQKELDEISYPDSHRISKEITQYVESFPQTQQNKVLTSVMTELRNNKPWEYIRGSAEFKGYIFKVNKHTLIPRIETEQLVDMVITSLTPPTKYIVDVCSGSGCILISIVLELQKQESLSGLDNTTFLNNIKFVAIEKDEETIKVLKQNLRLHKLEGVIEVIQSDLLNNYPHDLNNTIIVTNPPYISFKDYKKLDKSVLDYEPELALVGGKHGYEITQKLLEQVQSKSPKNGARQLNLKICIETAPKLTEYLRELSQELFPHSHVNIIDDIYNQKRFVTII